MIRASRPTAVWMKRIDSSMSRSMSCRPAAAHRLGHVVAAEQLAEVPARQAELLAEALEVDQRRAQVVRDAVDEHLVLLLLLAEVVGHVVEGAVDLGDLVAAGQRAALSGFPSANRRALSRRTASRWMIPWRNSRARIKRRDHDRRAPADERPDLPRRGRAEVVPSAAGPAPPPRRGPRRWSPAGRRGAGRRGRARPSPDPDRRSGPAGPRRRSSPGRRRIRPASSLDPGRLPALSDDQLPQLADLRRHPRQGGLVPPGRWPGRRRRSGRGSPRSPRSGCGAAPRPWR